MVDIAPVARFAFRKGGQVVPSDGTVADIVRRNCGKLKRQYRALTKRLLTQSVSMFSHPETWRCNSWVTAVRLCSCTALIICCSWKSSMFVSFRFRYCRKDGLLMGLQVLLDSIIESTTPLSALSPYHHQLLRCSAEQRQSQRPARP